LIISLTIVNFFVNIESSSYKPNPLQGGDGKLRISVIRNEMAGLPGVRRPGFLWRLAEFVPAGKQDVSQSKRYLRESENWHQTSRG